MPSEPAAWGSMVRYVPEGERSVLWVADEEGGKVGRWEGDYVAVALFSSPYSGASPSRSPRRIGYLGGFNNLLTQCCTGKHSTARTS